MEYFSGAVTLQMIFARYWESYCQCYTGTIRDTVLENVQKILSCRTAQLGFHL